MQPDFKDAIVRMNQQKEQEKERSDERLFSVGTTKLLMEEMHQASNDVIDFLKKNVLDTRIDNLPTEISVPEIKEVIARLEALEDKDDMSEMCELMEKLIECVGMLPKEHPEQPEYPEPPEEVTVKNQPVKELVDIKDAVTNLKLNPIFDPKITVKPSDVKVVNDFKQVIDKLDQVIDAFNGLSLEVPAAPVYDDEKLRKAVQKVTEAVRGLEFPVPNIKSSFVNSTGKAVSVVTQSDGSVPVTVISGGGSSSSGKVTDAYGWQATSDDGTYKYFFFEDASLNYYVLRKQKATKVATYTKGTGGYATVYVSSTAGPSGSPTWASYGTTF